MNSRLSTKSVILFTAISVTWATLAPETSAQSRPTPGRQLSDAVAEVLRSPFYGHHALLGLGGQGLLLPPVGYPNAVQGRSTSLSMGIESGTLSGIENGTLWTGPCGGSVATGAGAGPEW